MAGKKILRNYSYVTFILLYKLSVFAKNEKNAESDKKVAHEISYFLFSLHQKGGIFQR